MLTKEITTKETPILFTPENVRAILDGRKTQTRRIVKQPNRKDGAKLLPELLQSIGVGSACPYGQPGDRLWVRETWTARTDVEPRTDKAKKYVRYKADNSDLSMEWHRYHHWSPSIHMPKMYCRLWLELTEVRVQRLNECSEEDAIAEGMVRSLHFGKSGIHRTPQEAYRSLWESINGAGSWAANPWVWVLTFRKVNHG